MTPFSAARWVTIEELDEGRWSLTLLDDADDEIRSFGMGIEGSWDPDVVDHVDAVLAQLGLRYRGSRPWDVDEVGAHRAPVLPS
ncbi:hypothetical protein [Curtobacterium sp. Leaf261]|uniref:hypothetical protein n=1 Tax=Curtobacterium sp. Leaf261 TaxID=1736311 RepID=UPI000ACAEE23|nr:hypothetical protein [Curtobacterium sp. Leaf261]